MNDISISLFIISSSLTFKSNSINISCSKSVTGQLVQLVVADITGDMILVVLSSGASKYEVFSYKKNATRTV